MNHKKHFALFTAFALLAICLVGCQTSGDTQAPASSQPSIGQTIILSGDSITAGDGIAIDGTTATITQAGTYEISGTLTDGQILVDAAGDVTLILNQADITCSTSSPLYIKDAKHVTITLTEGTVNTLTDGTSYDLADSVTEPDATLYSKSDLTINGAGTLQVNANYNDAITSKDTLLIESGTISVTAVNHGIKGKDYLMITGGTISVQAGGDGLKATNDAELSLGYVEISGGALDIIAGDEGISAITSVEITGGTIAIDTANNGIKAEGTIQISGGSVDIQTQDDGLVCAEESIGEGAIVTINGETLSAT